MDNAPHRFTTACVTLKRIVLEPVWEKNQIILFDMYTKNGVWLGSKRLFKYCKEYDDQLRS